MARLIESQNLVTNFYTYEGVVKALNSVSLAIDHGVTFGLVGESGCGKSVFVRSLMRIIQAPGKVVSGKVMFHPKPDDTDAGIDLLTQSESFMQGLRGNQISMIFQEPNAALNPIMSIGEQIAESFLIHQQKDMYRAVYERLTSPGCTLNSALARLLTPLYRLGAKNHRSILLRILNSIPLVKRWNWLLHKEALHRCVEILAKLHIANPEKIVSQFPNNLSGGMKQRIVIAIALACNPVLLIADEATSNLDVTIQAQILELIRELKKKYISSILLITHDLGIVAETCDRVGVMYAGNLCELGSVKKIFSEPLHPYTQALLDSVPKLSQDGRLQSIPGRVPNLITPPTGCRFHPRCPLAEDICKAQTPDVVELLPDHFVACHVVTRKLRQTSPS